MRWGGSPGGTHPPRPSAPSLRAGRVWEDGFALEGKGILCDNDRKGKNHDRFAARCRKKIALLAHEANTTIAGYLSSLVAHLPEPKRVSLGEANDVDAIAAKLVIWQAEDGSELFPDVSVRDLLTRFGDEDSKMTETEREKEYTLWVDIENSLHGQRGLAL